MDAYAVSSSGLVATNQESSTAEDIGMYATNQVLAFAGGMIPVVGGFVNILVDGVNKVHDSVKSAKQDNKISVINELLRRGHTLPSQIEHSIAQAALEIVKRKGSVISTPVEEKKKHVLIEKASELREKIGKLTDKLLKKYQLEQSPQAEMAVEDVVLLMARLYEQYEMLKVNRSGAKFYEQVAELVCIGNLEDMLAKTTEVSKTDLSLVAGIFDNKTLKSLKKKASEGLWKKTLLSKGCEEYFEQKSLEKCLKNAKVVVSDETILAARIVLFKAMNEGMLENKKPLEALKCADGFGKAYPELTKQIAKEYPEYFLDIAIAGRCIKDESLLAEVKTKLPAKSRW
jgi:hypothetical protein